MQRGQKKPGHMTEAGLGILIRQIFYPTLVRSRPAEEARDRMGNRDLEGWRLGWLTKAEDRAQHPASVLTHGWSAGEFRIVFWPKGSKSVVPLKFLGHSVILQPSSGLGLDPEKVRSKVQAPAVHTSVTSKTGSSFSVRL